MLENRAGRLVEEKEAGRKRQQERRGQGKAETKGGERRLGKKARREKKSKENDGKGGQARETGVQYKSGSTTTMGDHAC